MEDQRFTKIKGDAKFRLLPKKVQKVKIDNRFQSMFKDDKFKEEYNIDERGRPITHSTNRDLKQYYDLNSSDENSSESEEESEGEAGDSVEAPKKPLSVEKKLSSSTEKKLKNLRVDYARGEQNLFSDSSSDDEESEDEMEEEGDEEDIDHKWGELDAETDRTSEATKRLAVCNMDWDRIRAMDIMVLLNSFLPPGGTIESVKIYLSEFGKKRLEEEDISGPPELRQSKLDEGLEETEEGSKYCMEKLRQYQLNRLKYYYAVVTFSDSNTANKVYMECDGMEYESSATKMDLRFIPDDMEFEEPKEVCDVMPEMAKYKPRFFITTALQQAKVNLTWDETNPERIEITEKLRSGKLEEVDKTELDNYVALSEDENSEEDVVSDIDENPVEKYKGLLMAIAEKEKEKQDNSIQMELTWGIEQEKKSQELVKKKLAEKEEKTPFQQYLDKRKEKRKEKKKLRKEGDNDNDSDIPSDIDLSDPYFAEEFDKSEFSKKKSKPRSNETKDVEQDEQNQAELELLLMNEKTEGKNHFSLKKIQELDSNDKKSRRNKRKIKKTEAEDLKLDDFEINVGDARFSAVFSSHLYNIDPSDPHYKKTKGMEKLISEKLKRRADGEDDIPIKKNKIENVSRKKAELNVLVKSVKRKTESVSKNK